MIDGTSGRLITIFDTPDGSDSRLSIVDGCILPTSDQLPQYAILQGFNCENTATLNLLKLPDGDLQSCIQLDFIPRGTNIFSK